MKTAVKNNTVKSNTRNANAKKNLAKLVESKKVVKKSKGQLKIEARIKQLEALKGQRSLTMQEIVYLENARIKLESRSISKVYNYLKNEMPMERRQAILGKKTFPTFKEFADKMPQKMLYSYFDGLRVLVKFNTKAKTQTKVQRQNKAEAKK